MRPLVRPPAPSATAPAQRGPERFVGRRVAFDLPDHPGVRAQGTVIAARDNGVRGRGAIPDFILDVRGQSGRVVSVSIFDSYATLID